MFRGGSSTFSINRKVWCTPHSYCYMSTIYTFIKILNCFNSIILLNQRSGSLKVLVCYKCELCTCIKIELKSLIWGFYLDVIRTMDNRKQANLWFISSIIPRRTLPFNKTSTFHLPSTTWFKERARWYPLTQKGWKLNHKKYFLPWLVLILKEQKMQVIDRKLSALTEFVLKRVLLYF